MARVFVFVSWFCLAIPASLQQKLYGCHAAEAAAAPESGNPFRPNIIVMLADNLGYNDIGVFGAPHDPTPYVDGLLGAQGLQFTHWNSAAHLCSASRASLLTGQYPVKLGVYPSVFLPDASQGLAPSQHPSLAQALKDRGYATSIVGKWHLGHREPYLPLQHGFDEWLGIPYHMSGGSVDDHTCATDVNETAWLPLYHNDQIVQQPVRLDQLAERYAQQAIMTMSKSRAEPEPFFLFLSFSHVHQLCAPRDYFEQDTCQWSRRQNGTRFVDAVHEMDWIVGRVLTALDELELTNDTVVWFTSDNGPWVAEQACSGSKGPFLGTWLAQHAPEHCTACPHDYVPSSNGDTPHECHLPANPSLTLQGVPCGHDTGLGSVWEANLRMPTLVRWPGRIQPNTSTSLPVSTLDLLPTILGMVDAASSGEVTLSGKDVSAEKTQLLDGMDLSPLLLQNSNNNRTSADSLATALKHRPLFFWRDGFAEGPLPPPYGRMDVAAVKLDRYKLWFWTKSGHYNADVEQYHDPPLLFDILADPAEAHPLNATAYTSLIVQAKAAVAQHKRDMEPYGTPLTLQRNPQYVPCVNRDTKCRTFPKPISDGAASDTS